MDGTRILQFSSFLVANRKTISAAQRQFSVLIIDVDRTTRMNLCLLWNLHGIGCGTKALWFCCNYCLANSVAGHWTAMSALSVHQSVPYGQRVLANGRHNESEPNQISIVPTNEMTWISVSDSGRTPTRQNSSKLLSNVDWWKIEFENRKAGITIEIDWWRKTYGSIRMRIWRLVQLSSQAFVSSSRLSRLLNTH